MKTILPVLVLVICGAVRAQHNVSPRMGPEGRAGELERITDEFESRFQARGSWQIESRRSQEIPAQTVRFARGGKVHVTWLGAGNRQSERTGT
ncbi:MAG: hypothetical protein GY946_22310 [bacterium]|nr:hypothetical protein [bacterium]